MINKDHKFFKYLPTIGGLACLIIAVLYFRYAGVESTDNAYVQADISIISPQISANINQVKCDNGDVVQQGTPLIILDDTQIKAKVASTTAQLAAQEALIKIAEDKIALQALALKQAQAMLASAQAEASKAKKDLSRNSALTKENLTSEATLDNLSAESTKANSSYKKAEAEVEIQTLQLSLLEQQLIAAKEQYKQIMSALDSAKYDLNNTIITAPISGIVGNRTAQVGNFARAGAPLIALVPTEKYIIANFKESQVAKMRPGQRAKISIDAFPDLKVRAWVHSISPASGAVFSLLPPENATGNFTKIVQRIPVRLSLQIKDDAAKQLQSGLSAVVAVKIH